MLSCLIHGDWRRAAVAEAAAATSTGLEVGWHYQMRSAGEFGANRVDIHFLLLSFLSLNLIITYISRVYIHFHLTWWKRVKGTWSVNVARNIKINLLVVWFQFFSKLSLPVTSGCGTGHLLICSLPLSPSSPFGARNHIQLNPSEKHGRQIESDWE